MTGDENTPFARVTRRTAEQLLSGAAGSGPKHLIEVLGVAAVPAREGELAGEQAAMAVFEASLPSEAAHGSPCYRLGGRLSVGGRVPERHAAVHRPDVQGRVDHRGQGEPGWPPVGPGAPRPRR